LEIDEAEADIVRLAYDLYLNGFEERVMGCKEIAKHLAGKARQPLYASENTFHVI